MSESLNRFLPKIFTLSVASVWQTDEMGVIFLLKIEKNFINPILSAAGKATPLPPLPWFTFLNTTYAI